MNAALQIRDPIGSDEASWRRLWGDYNRFFGSRLPDDITDHTWRRILDPASPIFARMAATADTLVGFAVCVLHEGTWVRTPICYLEDLFVAAEVRGQGVGRRLIEDLTAIGHSRGWARLYWHTQADNPARRLYDTFLPADEFVRYRMMLTRSAP